MQYSKVTSEDILALQAICGKERVVAGKDISEDFYHDELALEAHPPEVLVEPISTEEVSKVMAYAHRRNIPVTPRGAGTGLCGGAVAIRGGILLCTARMNKVLEIDHDNLMAVVEPGVILMEFQKLVEEQGLFYPPDPGEKTATIGGNVSTNAGGMRAVKYGVTRDYVLGLEAVLPDGRIIETGGKVVKNSSGYNLTQLLIGSEGTLAIITKIVLRLLPKPQKQLSLLVPFHDLDTAIGAVPRIISAKIVPTAIEFMQREILKAAERYLGRTFPDSSAPAYLLLTFYGSDMRELEGIYEQAAQVCLECDAVDVFIANTSELQESLWTTRGAFLEALKALSEIEEVDVVVPPSQIANFIRFTETLRARFNVRILSFGHAGDGNLHIYVLRDSMSREEWLSKTNEIMELMYREARRIRGLVSGEHGIGYAKRPFLSKSLQPEQITLMQGIKQVFDPKNILNPGKVVGMPVESASQAAWPARNGL